MRIAILLLNSGRGSGEVARAHCRRLVEAGHEIILMHPGVGAGVPGCMNIDIELHGDITPVHEYLPSAGTNQKPVSSMAFDEAMAYAAHYETALESVIDEVDVVIGHHANLSAIATARVARRHGKPYVLFLHGTGIEPRHFGGYDDAVWAEIENAIVNASGLLVTTQYVRDELVRALVDVPEERFLILPCGIDLEAFHPNEAGDIAAKYDLPERYAICPGALMAIKGPQNVVAASARYASLAPTIFIGDGELRAELAQRLGDRGRFLGFVSAQDKAQLINGATVLVAAPEKKEHFGIIYAEALAGGTVPVAYEGGGVASIITKDVGVLTERDPDLLGDAVADLLKDDDRRERLARSGRTRAEAHYHYPSLIEELVSWLQQLHLAASR